jgi:hypothetical protein
MSVLTRRADVVSRRSRAGRTALGLVALAVGAVLAPGLRADNIGVEALSFAVVWIGCLLLVSARHPSGILCPSGIYLIVFGLFHGGLLFSVGLRGEAGKVVPLAAAWIDAASVPDAVRLSMLGAVAFTAATLLVRSRNAGAPPVAATPVGDTEALGRTSFRIGLVGLGALVTGIASVSITIVVGGGLSAGYDAVFSSGQGSALLSYGLLLLGIGAVTVIVGTPAQRRTGLVLFTLFALVAVPLGMRGPILFVAAAVLAIEVRRGLRVRPVVGVLAVVALLLVIGVVRESRLEGPSAILKADWVTSPLDAVGEMGFSLYPTVVVYQWHADGEELRHGTTFIAVPLRAFERFEGEPPPDVDGRLFDQEILTRVGGIGGSPVAEGYHNFGALGVVGLMAAIGVVIAGLDRRRVGALNDAVLGVVLLPFLTEVRNFFAAVPAQILVGLLLIGLALLIPKQTRVAAAVAAARERAPTR